MFHVKHSLKNLNIQNYFDIDIEDISKKLKDSTYLNDQFVEYTDKGIKILYVTDKIVEILKKYKIDYMYHAQYLSVYPLHKEH